MNYMLSFRFAAKRGNNAVSDKYEEENVNIEPNEDSDVRQERKDVGKYVTVRFVLVCSTQVRVLKHFLYMKL